jgi:tripartite ATP-independent transporter DctM subunit
MLVAACAFATLIGLMAINVPIAFALGLAVVLGIMITAQIPIMVLPQRMFYGLDTFTLIAVPLFMLTGRLMALGGVTRDLLDISKALVGFLRGGLAYVNIIASMIFAGITGSAAADTSSIGAVLIPAMVEKGYEPDFSVAVTATSSTIGVMIPPSIPMVIYGVASSNSIGKLFLGGVVPGVLTGIALMIVTFFLARKRNYPMDAHYSLKEKVRILFKGIPALMTIVIIIGGIITGVFTPTEAAGIAAAYAFILGVFYYRELKIKDIPNIILEVGLTTGMVALMVSTASALGWMFANQGVPRLLAQFILSVTDNKILILMMVNILLLFVGTWLDLAPAIIIFTPVLLPVVTQVGVDPIHFGVIMVVNLAIGLFTPPVGVCLFVACGIAKISITDTIKAFMPFFIAMVIVLMIITYIPETATFIPNLLMP